MNHPCKIGEDRTSNHIDTWSELKPFTRSGCQCRVGVPDVQHLPSIPDFVLVSNKERFFSLNNIYIHYLVRPPLFFCKLIVIQCRHNKITHIPTNRDSAFFCIGLDTVKDKTVRYHTGIFRDLNNEWWFVFKVFLIFQCYKI